MIPGSFIIWRRRVVTRMGEAFPGPSGPRRVNRSGLFYDPPGLSMWHHGRRRMPASRASAEQTNISRRAVLAGAASILAAPAPGWAQKADKVVFGTNWRAQAEHGGFYQAVATGLYRKRGLEVTIRQGGPQVNSAQLLAARRLDFNMGASLFRALNYLQSGVPLVTTAAIFQKDPQILMAHPGQGNDSLAALKGKPIMIS